MTTPFKIFDTAEALGEYAARRIVERVKEGIRQRGRAAIGCPSGRSPRSTYAALAQLLSAGPLDGARLHLVMMDEYIAPDGDRWRTCPRDAHYSCTGFGEVAIRGSLNASPTQPIPHDNLHVPDPNDPPAFERTIERLGGIDVFLLASGESDGHVAFNGAGTPLDAGTRRIELSEATRRDNMKTFPVFRALDDVPRFGVTVGPATITRWSRAAILVLIGSAKGRALEKVLSVEHYDPAWPATVVHACRNAEILADRAAFTAMRGVG